ncbi:MAG: iron ABC transporter permease [Planctomycetota bacterium]
MTAVDNMPAATRPTVSIWHRLGVQGRPTVPHLLLTVAILLFFAVFLIWPICQVVIAGFRDSDGDWTLRYLTLVLTDPIKLQGLWNAAVIAILTTALSFAIALPLATISVKYEFPFKGILSGLLLVPLVLPPFVGAVGMRQVLSRYGPFTQVFAPGSEAGIDWLAQVQLFGIVLVEALHLYPILLLNLQAALANMDPAMEQAARNLGASRWTVFRKVTLPLIRPGVFAGCTLVFIWSFTELGTPLMFDYDVVTPVQVFTMITEGAENPVAYTLVVVMLAASVLFYAIGKLLLGRGFDAATTKASVAATPKKLNLITGFPVILLFLLVIGIAVIPHLSVIFTSITSVGAGEPGWYKSILPQSYTAEHFGNALTDKAVFGSIVNSLFYATIATAVAIIVGLGVAVIVVRSNVPGKGLIDALAMLPLAVPGLVLAFGFLSMSIGFRQWFGDATDVNTADTGVALWWTGLFGDGAGPLFWLNVQEYPVVLLVLAYAARRLPYVVRSAVAGLQQTPRDLELAASNLGAKKSTVLRKITVPLIVANLLAGGLLAFAFAMLEVSDSLILAQRADYYPITKTIYELSQTLGTGIYLASALGVWAMIMLTLTILTANSLMAKKLGAIFRI